MELTAANLIKIPPLERDKYYRFPHTVPGDGEPDLYEIMWRMEHNRIWGRSHFSISKQCPVCGFSGEWVRGEWAICYICLIAFEHDEWYIDLTIDEEMEYMEDE